LLLTAIIVIGPIVTFLIIRPTPPFPPKGFGKDLPPARLLNGFYSYSTTETVRAQLAAASLPWEVVRERRVSTSSDQKYTVAKVPEYSHLDAKGELVFHFFRDRLMRIEFVPPDPKGYWAQLVRAEGLKAEPSPLVSSILRAKPRPEVEIWLNIERDRGFVGWLDTRLSAEVSYISD
jgi:hypothetical protein